MLSPSSLRAREIAASLLLGALLGLAWVLPGSTVATIAGWATALGLAFVVRHSARPYRDIYVIGVLSHIIAFDWLLITIESFGGFPFLAALGIFLFFVFVSSLQFLIFSFVFRHLPKALDKIAFRAPVAWVTCELLSIRIFPWHLGHTQIAFLSFAQVADLGGAVLISFMMIWVAEALLRSVTSGSRSVMIPAIGSLLVLLAYGWVQLRYFDSPEGPRQQVALIQGNVSLEEKHSIKYFTTNVSRYLSMSEPHQGGNTLIIWPESVLQAWIRDDVGMVTNDRRLPQFSSPTSILFGGLSYGPSEERYNSAFALFSDGTVPPPYHKQVLMPFGEYTPFSQFFPWLKEMNATAGDFTPGDSITVFPFPIGKSAERRIVRVAPLICYEDILPHLSRRAVLQGADLLINLTNDAWFGDTVAPFQHHLIASFRAIETRRFLLRSTNTGLTAIVSPSGRTLRDLPPFSEGTLLAETSLLRYRSLYTVIGDLPWWIMSILAGIFALGKSLAKNI